jgi:dipeptidyl aminopeptidase/acylaminoacyl peptidase
MMLRNKIINALTVLILGITLFSCDTGSRKTKLLSVEDFFKNPTQSGFRLSPDGNHISFLKSFNNRLNIHVLKIGLNDTAVVTKFNDRDIKQYFWANNSKIVFLRDNLGDENFKLYSVNIDGNELKQLSSEGDYSTRVINDLVESENELIISDNSRDSGLFDLYRVNISTGNKKMIAENPGNISDWLVDHSGQLRVAISTDGVNTGILYRSSENENFELKAATNFKQMLYPVAFTFDNKNVYAISNRDRDKAALVIYDLQNDREIEELFEHHEVDINSVLLSRKKEKVIGVTYTTWKMKYEFFDEHAEDVYRNIQNKLPAKEIILSSLNRNENRMIVRTASDKSMGTYYFYDADIDSLVKLSEIAPWLEESEMSPMKPISYKARDNLTINGYLTVPRNLKAKKLPVVVFPHGGPWIRDTWGFNNAVQFLANRGFAVLQPNYRGSHGYGREFWQAGFREWGGKMQDDIADGVEWLIKQEIADEDRVAILGVSFGGYCALQSMIKYPELYKCGISQGAINNLIHFVKMMPNEWKPYEEMIYEMIGDPKKDKKFLVENSPYFNIDKIKSPVFIAQGKNDKLVDPSSTDLMAKKLMKNEVDVEYMFAKNEGHVFQNEENRIEFFKRTEKFLNAKLLNKFVD